MPQKESVRNQRMHLLERILSREREAALARVHEYRAAQEGEVTTPPGDELDEARALADIETEASLIERAEVKLHAIDAAFELLREGRYGLCAACGEEIPLERLRVLPFAINCVDCQRKRNRLRQIGRGTIDEPFAHQWELPEEMAESTETSHDEFVPLPEDGAEEPLPSSGMEAPRRRRGRPPGRRTGDGAKPQAKGRRGKS